MRKDPLKIAPSVRLAKMNEYKILVRGDNFLKQENRRIKEEN
jgi:hypothetical protein